MNLKNNDRIVYEQAENFLSDFNKKFCANVINTILHWHLNYLITK